MERAFKPLEEVFGLYRAVDITKDKLLEYIVERRKQQHMRRGKLQPIQPATYQYELAMLKRGFNLAMEAEKLDHMPPFPEIEVHNVRERFFTEAEFESVHYRLPVEVQPLIEFLWLIGWRLSELPTAEEPPRASAAYTREVERANSMIVPWVFHRDGKPIKSFRGAWEKACKKIGLPGAWVHDFRRCVVRRFEDNHVKRGAAMAVIGQKTESIYKRYNITTAGDVANAIEAIADYTEKPSSGKVKASRPIGRRPDEHTPQRKS